MKPQYSGDTEVQGFLAIKETPRFCPKNGLEMKKAQPVSKVFVDLWVHEY